MRPINAVLRVGRKLLADVKELFRNPLSGPHREEMVNAQREIILSRTVVLIWISVVVMPTTLGGFTFFAAPEHLAEVMAIVSVAVVLVLVHRAAVVRGLFHKHYHLAMLLLVGGIFGPTGAAVLEITRGSRENLFFAFFLIFFAFTSLFPASARWILATSGCLIASRAGVEFLSNGAIELSGRAMSDMIYLLELTFIGLVLNRVVSRLFFGERLAQVELALANDGLREMDRTKTEFFSNISHELRTPLTLIVTPISHILHNRDDLDPEVHDVLTGARGNANRLLKMVNMLLDFSRVEAGHVEMHLSDMEVADILEYSASLFRGTCAQRGLELRLACGTPELRVACDIDKLEQILVNLIGNAMKFTPEGGSITLASEDRGDMFVISVRDTGIGIPESQQSVVFQRFGQVESAQRHQATRGTGIGLAIVQEYANVMGGSVSLESTEGFGSTFSVHLPKRPPQVERQAAKPSRRTPLVQSVQQLAVADLNRETHENPLVIPNPNSSAPWVLVVDDNPSLVRLVSDILAPDYNIYTASSGEAALERMAQSKVDLVVSDVMMPGISGLELCRRIKSSPETNLVPVVLLTARGGRSSKIEGLDTGANDYIGKPFDPEELRARVRNLFDRERLIQKIRDKSGELQEALQAIHKEKEKLVASEKLRTLGDLAAGIFHELHNYMNMIYNGAVPLIDLVEMIRDEPDEITPEDFAEIIDLAKLMVEASEASLAITGELKAYAHQGANEQRPMDMNDVIRSSVRMFGKLRNDANIVLELTDAPLPIDCVPSRLLMVYTNLTKNAFEAMEDGGTVTISSERSGDRLEVRVRDEGPGVPESFRADLFAPFKTTKSQGKGLGLGLSLARKVVFDLGGELRYDDTYTDGAQFIFDVPLALSTEERESEAKVA
jgi:signal transduction histidine kinase